MQCLVYDFLDNGNINVALLKDEIQRLEASRENAWKQAGSLEADRDYWKERYQDRCNFLEEILPMVQQMNRKIAELTKQSEEEKRLRKRAKAVLGL